MSAISYVDLSAFRARARAATESGNAAPKSPHAIYRAVVAEPKAAGEGSRTVRFCFSDGSVDRMGDTIDAAGWVTHSFLKNPVALFAHDSNAPPIGRAGNLMVEDTRLMGDIEFAPPEVYEFADTIYRLVVGKFLNAVSVGFLPLEYDWSDDDEREWGLDFKRQELLEISVVPVPANGNALADARSKGIDTRPLVEWAEKTLEGGGRVILPRNELEQLRRAAKEMKVTKTRAKPAPRKRADEDNDPNENMTIGNCGRPLATECGMKDVSECSIHGNNGDMGMDDDADNEKRIAAIVDKAVKAALKKAKLKADDSAESDANSDERPDVSAEHEDSIRMCSMHLKSMVGSMKSFNEYHQKAMDAIDDVVDALDASPPPTAAGADEDQEAKAARLKRLIALRSRAA
jgi:HK97 family phage prohead protease